MGDKTRASLVSLEFFMVMNLHQQMRTPEMLIDGFVAMPLLHCDLNRNFYLDIFYANEPHIFLLQQIQDV